MRSSDNMIWSPFSFQVKLSHLDLCMFIQSNHRIINQARYLKIYVTIINLYTFVIQIYMRIFVTSNNQTGTPETIRITIS